MSLQTSGSVLRSFRDDLSRFGEEHAQERALVDARTGRVWTYGSLIETVQGFAGYLKAQGLKPSDRLFSILPNSIEQLVASLASLWGGWHFCPISPLSGDVEVRRFIEMTGARIGLVPETLSAAMHQKLSASASVERLVTMSHTGDFSDRISVPGARMPASGPAGKFIIFTSGTTASPKAIVVDGDRLWSSAAAWAAFHEWMDGDARLYNVLPMSYLGGLFNLGLIPLAAQGSVVVSDAFSAASALRFWREVEEHDVNTLWLTPTMLRALLTLHRPGISGRAPWRQVRAAFVGMASATLEDKQRFEEVFGIPVLENYALSETTFLTSERLGSTMARRPGSVGHILPWVSLRTRAIEEKGPQELVVKTPYLFDGYLDAKGSIERPSTADGWFATGDLGSVDSEGLVRFEGRTKEIIKKGGYLLMLRDLEEVAETHAAVVEAAAVGVPHDFYGETAVLCVRLANDAEPEDVLQDVKALLQRTLAKFKWPSELVACSALPRTDSGKVRKRVLAESLGKGETVLASVRIS